MKRYINGTWLIHVDQEKAGEDLHRLLSWAGVKVQLDRGHSWQIVVDLDKYPQGDMEKRWVDALKANGLEVDAYRWGKEYHCACDEATP